VYNLLIYLIKITTLLAFLFLDEQYTTFNSAITGGRIRFFCEKSLNAAEPYSAVDIVFGITELILKTTGLFWTDFFVAMVSYGAIPITFWVTTMTFQADMFEISKSPESIGIPARLQTKILGKYEQLKNLTNAINGIWSTSVILHVVDRTLVMIFFHHYVSQSNRVGIAFFAADIVFVSVALFLMAEGARNVRILRYTAMYKI